MHLRISLPALPRTPPPESEPSWKRDLYIHLCSTCLSASQGSPSACSDTREGKEHTRLVHTTYTDRTGRSRFNKERFTW